MTTTMPIQQNYHCVHCGADHRKPISSKKPKHGDCQVSFCLECKRGIAIVFGDDWCSIFKLED